jgi:hypothetical protein
MMPKGYPSEPIDYLVERRRNALQILPASQEQLVCFSEEIGAYRAELQRLSNFDLDLRVCQELAKEARAQDERERPFYSDWGRLPRWTLKEAVALTLGKNPELVTWSSVEGYVEVYPLAVHSLD